MSTFAVESIAICLTTIWIVSLEGKVYFNPDVRQCGNIPNPNPHSNSSWFEVFVKLDPLDAISPTKPFNSLNKIPYAIAHTAHTVFMPSIQLLPNGVRKFSSKFSNNNVQSLTVQPVTKIQICCSILSGVWILVEGCKVYHSTSQLIGVNYLPLCSTDTLISPFISVAASYASDSGGK